MNQTASGIGYSQNASTNSIAPIKGTAVDSINANIESLTNRAETLTRFAARISDGILGVVPATDKAEGGPRPVVQSTQDHIRDLDAAFERLSVQINRLG